MGPPRRLLLPLGFYSDQVPGLFGPTQCGHPSPQLCFASSCQVKTDDAVGQGRTLHAQVGVSSSHRQGAQVGGGTGTQRGWNETEADRLDTA